MKVDRALRFAIAAAIVAVFLVGMAALLFLTESALNVWDRLRGGPVWLFYGYVGTVFLLATACLWAVWRFVVPRRLGRRRRVAAPARLTESALRERLRAAESAGVDVGAAEAELEALAARRAEKQIHVALFGEISTGKSSLIKALLPEATVTVSPVGGSTREIRRYAWESPTGIEVHLTDVPGTGGELDATARDEARRAHVVVYLVEGDLSRQESGELAALLETSKPTILALNKSDRLSDAELAQVLERLRERVAALAGERTAAGPVVVPASAGGEEELVIRTASGGETRSTRRREPDVAELVLALNELLRRDPETLAAARDEAVFALAAEKLEAAEAAYRARRSETIVRGYTRKAVIGALAAVSPGSDIVIQGYLGTAMTRELCALYGVAARDLDVEQFLDLSQGRVGRALPLTLAVAGNGLKAFPGMGTVAGGLVHAVAYGLIFDALGRSLAASLAARGELEPRAAAEVFEESLSEHLEAGVRRVARLALRERRDAAD